MSRPRTFLRTFVRVRFHECDPLGHLNNTVYLGYLEQAAIDHAALAGWPAARLQAEFGAVFVARRHDIEFLRPAFENDILEITTWPETMGGARATRHYLIRKVESPDLIVPPPLLLAGDQRLMPGREELVVRATTEWAFTNLDRGRVTRMPPSLIDDFQEPDA
jgi:acyl-CoA thioester hydrolase